MLSNVENLFINSKSNIEPQEIVIPLDPDNDKVIITLKQVVRDWTDLGSNERDLCYRPILEEIAKHFDINDMQKNQFKIVSSFIFNTLIRFY